MKVAEIASALGCEVVVDAGVDRDVTGCYVSDMLSDVLAHSGVGNVWITQHTHANIVVVAAVKELAAVIVTGAKEIEPETVRKARSEGVTIMRTGVSAFEAAGEIYARFKGK